MTIDFSSDYDFAQEVFTSEILDGNETADLQQLDAMLAEQLQFQDALLNSMQINPGASESSPIYCEICFEPKEENQMFPIWGCSHSFCSDCISMHVKARLEENEPKIMCPAEDCRILMKLEACRDVLSKQVVNLWEDLLCEELLCATGGRLYCPFKDCSASLLNDDQGEVIAETECPHCYRLFCAQCLASWHQGRNCDEYDQKLDEDDRGRQDILLMNLAEENKWRSCPNCHIIVERTQGCPHMTCRCKSEFCYTCGAEWTDDHVGCQDN